MRVSLSIYISEKLCGVSIHFPLNCREVNMNTTLIVLALVAAAYAMPQLPKIIPVVSKSFVQDSVGQFTFEYESGDGTKYKESGRLVPNANGTDNVLVKEGVVSYTSPEGIPVTLTYKADTLGFRPTGDHLPVPVVV